MVGELKAQYVGQRSAARIIDQSAQMLDWMARSQNVDEVTDHDAMLAGQ